jgi:hypothetical protein
MSQTLLKWQWITVLLQFTSHAIVPRCATLNTSIGTKDLTIILPNSIQWNIRLFTHIKNVIENGYNEDASSIKNMIVRSFVPMDVFKVAHLGTIAWLVNCKRTVIHCHFNSITQWQLCISHHCTQLLTLTAHQQGPSLFLVSCGSAGSVSPVCHWFCCSLNVIMLIYDF